MSRYKYLHISNIYELRKKSNNFISFLCLLACLPARYIFYWHLPPNKNNHIYLTRIKKANQFIFLVFQHIIVLETGNVHTCFDDIVPYKKNTPFIHKNLAFSFQDDFRAVEIIPSEKIIINKTIRE